MTRGWPALRAAPGDDPALARARRQVAAMVAGAVLLGVLLASAVTWVAVVRSRDVAADQALASAAAHADDAQDPPPDVWLFIREPSGELKSTPGAPEGLPLATVMDRVGPGHPDQREVSIGGTEMLVRTVSRGGAVVQAVEDLSGREAERHRLAGALLLALVVGVGLALVSGTALARWATRPLADALARQRRFVADASHELRTPLSRLAMRAELLTRELASGPAGPREDAEQLLGDARTMAEVLNDLLLSAQLRAHPGGGVDIDVASLVQDVVAADELRAERGGIALSAATGAGAAAPAVVHGSPPALRRAVSALVANALAHTPPGGSVRVQVSVVHDRVVVEVSDTGEGLDPERIEELMQPFSRGHDDRRRFGLGLALVREVLEAHGGTLSARGAPGVGATWTVRLPASHRGRHTAGSPPGR
ncbi:sensor histidine kinase [Oryzihumus sp.]